VGTGRPRPWLSRVARSAKVVSVMEPWIAVTDLEWFDFLRGIADTRGRVDEVNFWNPSGLPMRSFDLGEPMFFRLGKPRHVIAGYGFFAHFSQLRLDRAWDFFREKNGSPGQDGLLRAIASKRHQPYEELHRHLPDIGCTILRDAVFWPPSRWIFWRDGEGWASSGIMRGRTERDVVRTQRLLGEIVRDHQDAPPELAHRFVLREADERKIIEARTVRREGQGTFRTVLLDAYGRQCSITGEHTLPVLDAAHIQPYLGPESNHVQNGLLLTKEFHTLFDLGYVTVTPEHRVRISRRLREEWHNGRRYYIYDGQPLAAVPKDPQKTPSSDALEWHGSHVFLK
jgi:putative restriction endonuclease